MLNEEKQVFFFPVSWKAVTRIQKQTIVMIFFIEIIDIWTLLVFS